MQKKIKTKRSAIKRKVNWGLKLMGKHYRTVEKGALTSAAWDSDHEFIHLHAISWGLYIYVRPMTRQVEWDDPNDQWLGKLRVMMVIGRGVGLPMTFLGECGDPYDQCNDCSSQVWWSSLTNDRTSLVWWSSWSLIALVKSDGSQWPMTTQVECDYHCGQWLQ